MPYLEKPDQHHEDEQLGQLRNGSVLMVAGFVFLGFAAMLGIYDFMDIRDGANTMLLTTGILGLIGLVLIAFGEVKRGSNAV